MSAASSYGCGDKMKRSVFMWMCVIGAAAIYFSSKSSSLSGGSTSGGGLDQAAQDISNAVNPAALSDSDLTNVMAGGLF
jgi:hypothetical protein